MIGLGAACWLLPASSALDAVLEALDGVGWWWPLEDVVAECTWREAMCDECACDDSVCGWVAVRVGRSAGAQALRAS